MFRLRRERPNRQFFCKPGSTFQTAALSPRAAVFRKPGSTFQTAALSPRAAVFRKPGSTFQTAALRCTFSGSEAGMGTDKAPVVGIIMGSQSDWPVMQEAARMLDAMGVAYEAKIVSAHRTPDRLAEYAKMARGRGIQVIIAGAGGAAHLPGMAAAMTSLPVLGVPVQSKTLSGLDSLLSIVQMPKGIPVGTLAIGEAGAANAGLLAASIIALQDAGVAARLDAFRAAQTAGVKEVPEG
jgi:5-(carboxyamino)imidazole ribonucleotide mutase